MGSDLTPHLDPDAARSWATAAVGRLQNIDSERLLSVLLDRGVDLPRDLLEQITNAPFYDPARVEICPAHRKTRPLYLALAVRWHEIGERDRAVGVIATVRRQMIDARQPADVLKQLDAVNASLSATPPASVEVKSTQQKWFGRLGSVASGVFALLIGLAGIGTVVTLTGAAIEWLAGRPQLLLPVVVAVVGVLVCFVIRSRGRALTAVFKPTLVLSVAGKGIRAVRWNYVARFPRLLNWTRVFAGEIGMPGSDPYVEEGARVSGLTDLLLPVRLFGRIGYELLMQPSLQPLPWEALAHAGLAGPQGKVKEQFQFYRSSFNVPTPRRRSWRDDNAVGIVGRAHDTTTLHQLWTRHVDPARLTISGDREAAKTALTSPIRVLHLVGRTRMGSGAQLFQVTAEGYQDASELQPDFAHVVIVQCRPQESFDRTQTDREQTASLRGFAAEVFEAGAGTVVFLPIMPATIGERVAHKLAEFCMRSTAPSRVAWLDHVSRLRAIILRSASRAETRSSEAAKRYQQSDAVSETETVSDEELAVATREMAMDVTLWLRDSRVPFEYQAKMLIERHFAA